MLCVKSQAIKPSLKDPSGTENLSERVIKTTVKVAIEGQETQEIEIPNIYPITCQTLLKEVTEKFKEKIGSSKILALRTANNNETMDFYLTLSDRYFYF